MEQIPIFVINLKKDTDKRKHMESLGKKYNLVFTFIEAVYGKNLSRNEIENNYDKVHALNAIGRELSVGEIGCALSHISIYHKMVDNNIETALILEDDIVFSDHILEALQSINAFPTDWECVLLCYYRISPLKKNYCTSLYNRVMVSEYLKVVRFTALMDSAAGYILNLSGASKLLKSLKEGIFMPLDHFTGDEKYINLYGIYPKIITIDLKYGLQSNIKEERTEVRNLAKGKKQISFLAIYNIGNRFRNFLKILGLFHVFKKINITRQKVVIPIEKFFYILFHIHKCIKKPRRYK